MSVYCDRLKLVQNNIRFVFDGNRIQEADTPATFDMVDDDAIEVFTQQTGGRLTLRSQKSREWRKRWR